MVGLNWRSRPLGNCRVFVSRRVRGQCHRLPRKGSCLSAYAKGESGGERCEPRSGQDRFTNQSRSRVTQESQRLNRDECEHSRSQTGRCYCEPVWWREDPATGDETEVAEFARRRNRAGKKGSGHRGMSPPFEGRRRGTGDDRGWGDKVRNAGGTVERGRPPERKGNVRGKRQDPSPEANDRPP